MTARYINIDHYQAQLNPWMQEVFKEVRMLFLTFPEMKETIRYHTPFYDCADKPILYLSRFEKKRFVLGFCNGHLMPDEAGLLKNEKKQTLIKHWEFYPNDPFDKHIFVD
jgi:hypothetical protein